MGLTLVAGPANAGKVALLLERYLVALPRGAVLIVPNRSDVERVERDLLSRDPCLLGGWIGTFDDLFERIGRAGTEARPALSDAQRALILRRTVAAAPLNGLGASARFSGFADALADAIRDLERGLLDPDHHQGSRLAELHAAYRAELERRGVWDRDLERRHAAERLASELEAWDGSPVFAYGFEDLTAAQWRLLEALAGRAEVCVSLPYEPGRPAFAALERTAADLGKLAEDFETMPPRYAEVAHPALAHLERALFADAAQEQPPQLEGAVRWLEGAGRRGTAELVGEEILALLRADTAPEEVLVVCPGLERWRAPIETAFTTLGIPYALEGRMRLGQAPFGHALLSLLRYAWGEPARRALFAFLRSPYSGLARAHADFLEGRLRGRAVRDERVEEEAIALRGSPFPALEALRSAPGTLAAVRGLAAAMARAAHGLEGVQPSARTVTDLRAYETVAELLDELEPLEPTREEVLHALERSRVRLDSIGEPGRVPVVELDRARTRLAETVFVLGLEGGSLPRRGAASPFLDDERRRELDESRGSRLVRPDPVARDRYLFYTACTRATKRLSLVREAAGDDGAPRDASPFWDETRAVFDPAEVARWTRKRPLSALTWPLEAAPTERERARAVAALAASDPDSATSVALANGWERRLERALAAFERPTRLTHPAVLEELRARATFSVTELEAFADCSSIWFVERVLSPRQIDAEVDARLRGSVAHSALYKFFSGVPKRLGADRVHPDKLDDAIAFMGECLEAALAGVRMELSELQRLELEGGLRRDLEAVVRAEAEQESPLVPSKFEVLFGGERSSVGGLDLGTFRLTGKIDRIDLDPFSARGIVQDYKSGASAQGAQKIEDELRLQIPLYMLVLRDLIGVEPLGGVYRPLAGKREARGLLRRDFSEDGVPGFHKNDYLEEDEFWGQVDGARERAVAVVERMRSGDVAHDPRFGPCPDWCELWTMCRVKRA
ncbi:MAG: PD-(D/E)XK nuclease family protein [Gaiellaceae bacterium]